MADTVQMTLEQMLPELEDLVKHEVFSKDEIKKIVAKRTKFEEKLARSCEKKVYYEYIKYETLLEELKRKKVRRLGIKLHEFSKKSGLYHIRRLFQRALNRYYDDPKLWQDYITFLQNTVLQGSLAQVFISAIQKHPRNASLWKQAAFWEYSNNRNIHGARALFQRAIRLNPTSQEIWLNYFSLELRYLTDVRDNYKTAGLQVEDKPRGTNTSDFMAVSDLPDDESRKGSQDQLRQDIAGYAEEFLAKSKPFLEGGIPKIVFANAIKSFPNDFQFCAQFYELTTHITGLITLREDILQSIATNFSQDNEALFFIAKERTKLNYSFEACWTIFEEAIKGADNTKRAGFYDVYVLFHQHLLGLGTSQATAISKHMNAVLEEARSSQSLSETTFSIWIDTLVNSNNIPEAEKLSQQAVDQFPSSIKLWRARINFPLQRLSGSKADAKQALEQIEELYTKAFKAVQNKEASQALWIDYFKLRFEHLSSKFDETLEHYKKCLYNLLDLGTHVRMAFLALLQENKELNNINNVRKVYNLTLSIPPANAEYFLECIKAEQSHGGDVTKIRALFEKAVNAHGKYNDDLWLEYIQFEYKNSNVTQGIHVYWKAKKALEDPTEFVRKYVLSTNGMDPAIANLE